MNKFNNIFEIVQSSTSCDDILNAYKMSLIEYSKKDITDILSGKNDEIKIIPIINLKSIDNCDELNLILSHLTGKDGRIREAVSYILSENPNCSTFIEDDLQNEIITKSILDINPNVVRNIINFIEKSGNYKEKITPFIVKKTKEVLEELSKFIKYNPKHRENKEKSQKNHAKNKLIFNLYWLLSSISILDVDNIKNLDEILTKTAFFIDYTIREKTALILSKMKNPPIELLQKLQQDENIYVKNQLL